MDNLFLSFRKSMSSSLDDHLSSCPPNPHKLSSSADLNSQLTPRDLIAREDGLKLDVDEAVPTTDRIMQQLMKEGSENPPNLMKVGTKVKQDLH